MLGYIAFLALLFLPGLAIVLPLRQAKASLVSLLALSYGLSLVVNSLVGFTDFFLGIPFFFLSVLELSISLLTVLLTFVARRKALPIGWKVRGDLRQFLPAGLLAVTFGAFVLSEFLKYPVFPKSYSYDFIQHSALVSDALAGGAENLSWSILYGGVHLNLAMGLSLAGGAKLVQLSLLMALLVAPSSLLIHEVGMALYGTSRQALLSQALYIITGFVWYVPLYDSGLYPNFFATILSLFYILLVLKFRESMNWRSYLLLLITSLGLYLTHYSVVLFVASVDIYLLIRLVFNKESLRFAGIVIATNIAPASVVFLRPDLIPFAASILGYRGPSSAFSFTTPLADALSSSFFIRYVVAEIYGYEDVVLLLLTIPIALYYIWSNRNRSPSLLLLAIWLGVLWVTAPQSDLTWRFSNQALAPIILLAPASFAVLSRALSELLGPGKASKGKRRGQMKRRWRITSQTAALTVILLILFSGSWANAMITDLTTKTSVYSNAQTDLYNSMVWFDQSTPAHSTMLSVTDWRIAFMQQLTGRYGDSLIFANATQAVLYARGGGFEYVLVTYLIPLDVPSGFDAVSYYKSFSSNPNLKEVYSNPTDVIYQVVS